MTAKATKTKSRIADLVADGNGNGTKHAEAGKAALTIQAPNFQVAEFRIRGTTVYVQHKFSEKAKKMMRDKQEAGSVAKKGKKRDPKDFLAEYEAATHKARDGGYGIPAGAFGKAMVAACRMVDFKMTVARQAIFVLPDVESADPEDRGGLVRITKGERAPFNTHVKIQQTTDLRARPLWEPGWEATVRVRFDADMFCLQDVANLLMRAGLQVGVGEGRPDTPSGGMGWGLFELLSE